MFILKCTSFSVPQVMEETDTQIAWPSKLKIGAKSKKGKSCGVPHLKCALLKIYVY